ncbi:phenylalanine--tRNA ligase beta subunit-related protein, partial [Mesomycoplasma ovipneumoniae]|uniref:phenylalanine--tRNA ligase beta subunit-related protein n=1 Tax=Mesomycoplasma ovipneumoniae TaxID=29562 RepID=UPI0030800437
INIAGKARILGVSSESAQRFERGVDFKLQKTAIELASLLINHYCGGEIHSIIENVNADYLPKERLLI